MGWVKNITRGEGLIGRVIVLVITLSEIVILSYSIPTPVSPMSPASPTSPAASLPSPVAHFPDLAHVSGSRAVQLMGRGGHPPRCPDLSSTGASEATLARWKGGRLRKEPAACSACDLGKYGQVPSAVNISYT